MMFLNKLYNKIVNKLLNLPEKIEEDEGITHFILTDGNMVFACYRSIEFDKFTSDGMRTFVVMDCVFDDIRQIGIIEKDRILLTMEDFTEKGWNNIENSLITSTHANDKMEKGVINLYG